MAQQAIYKFSEDEPDYVLVHKRTLVASGHCLGLAIQCYSIAASTDFSDANAQLSYYATAHVEKLSDEQIDFVVKEMIDNQNKQGFLDLSKKL